MTFKEKVKQIASAEKDVDKVLRAARLQRNPNDNQRLEMILNAMLAMTAIITGGGVFITYMLILASAR